MSYAISEYPDAREIYARLDALMGREAVPIRREAMEAYLTFFETSCPKSKAAVEEAKKYIPGGVQHNLAFNYPFPLVIERSEGAYLHDVDGHRYIDFLQAGGPTILGGNDPAVRAQVMEMLGRVGPSTGLFH